MFIGTSLSITKTGKATPFDPLTSITSANCALWLDPTDANTVTLTGSLIDEVADKSSNGLDLTFISGTKTTYDADGAIQFTGVDSWNDAGGTFTADSDKFNFLHNGDGGTVVMVVKIDSSNAGSFGALFSTAGFVSSGQTGCAAWFRDDGAFEQQLATNIVQTAGQAQQANLSDYGLELNRYMILSIKMGKDQTGDDLEARIDNLLYDTAEKGATAYGTADSNWAFLLGSSGSGTVGEIRFKEVLVFDDYLSDADMRALHTYLNNKHNVYQKSVPTHLLIGQSNAEGLAAIANATDFERGDITPRGYINSPDDDSGWVLMKAGDRGYARGVTQFGAEVNFLRDITASNATEQHAIIKYAVDSSSLHTDWADGGTVYEDAVTEINQAIAEMASQLGRSCDVQSIIWIQGEADSQGEAVANAYGTNLTQFLVDLANDVNGVTSETYMLTPQVYTDDAVTYPYVDEVNTGKQTVATANDYVSVMPNTSFATIASDDIHLGASTQELIGSYAADMFENPTNSVAPAVTGDTDIGDTLSVTEGTWNVDPRTATYQWQRDTVDISGATSSSYTLVEADDGTSIRCVVTAYTFGGSATANSNAVTAGVDRTIPMSDINSAAEFDLSATLSSSYGGTGQSWDNIITSPASGAAQGIYDAFLGTDGTVQTSDPTFTGTANDPAAKFVHDSGDLYRIPVMSTILEQIHRTDIAQDFTFLWALHTATAGSTMNLMWGGGHNASNEGFYIRVESAGNLQLNQRGDSGSSNIKSATSFVPAETDVILCVSYDHTSGVATFRAGSSKETVTQALNTCVTDAPQGYIDLMGYVGGGTGSAVDVYGIQFYNKSLSDAEYSAIVDQWEIRDERTYV